MEYTNLTIKNQTHLIKRRFTIFNELKTIKKLNSKSEEFFYRRVKNQ
jgi:hypothetical protein